MLGAAARRSVCGDLALGAPVRRRDPRERPAPRRGRDARRRRAGGAAALKAGRCRRSPRRRAGPGIRRRPSARGRQLRRDGARAVVLLAHPAGGWQEARQLAQATLGEGTPRHPRPPRRIRRPTRTARIRSPVLLSSRVTAELAPRRPAAPAARRRASSSPRARPASRRVEELDDRIARLRQQARAAPEDMRPLYADKIREVEAAARAALLSVQQAAPAGSLVITPTFSRWARTSVTSRMSAPWSPPTKNRWRDEPAAGEQQPRPARRQAPGSPPSPGISSAGKVKGCAECHESSRNSGEDGPLARLRQPWSPPASKFSLGLRALPRDRDGSKPGGVCRIDLTQVGGPGFQGRGKEGKTCNARCARTWACEHAEGPPGPHLDGRSRSASAALPRGGNSPHFDDGRYRPFIVGPGHGTPLKPGEKPTRSRQAADRTRP